MKDFSKDMTASLNEAIESLRGEDANFCFLSQQRCAVNGDFNTLCSLMVLNMICYPGFRKLIMQSVEVFNKVPDEKKKSIEKVGVKHEFYLGDDSGSGNNGKADTGDTKQ
jgi:hypothetical protein